MAIGTGAADRVERFLAAHPTGPLVVCVGSASVAGIVWLAQHSRGRRVTLFIGDMKSRNFALATDRDRSAAGAFVSRTDVDVRNWYRTGRSGQGRSEAHLKVWVACDDTGAPQAFLVGSANLTIAGLHENVELMALADASEHAYLRSTLQQLQDKSLGRQGALRGMDRARRRTRTFPSPVTAPVRPHTVHAKQATTARPRSVHRLRITGPSDGVPHSGRSRSAHGTEQASTLIQRSGVAAKRHGSAAHAGHRPRVLSRRRRSTRSTRLAAPSSDPVAVPTGSAPPLTCPFAAPNHQPPTIRGLATRC